MFLCAKAAARQMRGGGGGRIVNTASILFQCAKQFARHVPQFLS
ncbi:hypothetical protein RR42_s2284 [Cupriavidus basilensis]|uniref:Uncharacterized protein n=1 Tax=Cupriavidus basilensis TaxID=68895 RepID=A0A0C4YT70_9BURK|nr:hypothetical protein RR42_s2284 [Cupriavidus basilensis]